MNRTVWHKLRHTQMWHKMCHMTDPLFSAGIEFFRGLERDNTRAFWHAHRARYDDAIKPSFVDVLERLGGDWRIYRPHNDQRFSAAKGPYKTFIGAVTERPDGVGTFVQLSARGVLVGTGMPMLAADQLTTYRAAVASDDGARLTAAIDAARRHGLTVHAGRWEPLKRVPRGADPHHPRCDLLRWKGVETNTRIECPPWSTPAEASSGIRDRIELASQVDDWLGRFVGPSAMSPEERFAPRRR